MALRVEGDISEQLLALDSTEAVATASIDGDVVAVILIHHFVGVMVCVFGIDMTAVYSVITAALLRHAELLTKRMSKDSSRKINPNVILF